MLFHEWMIKNDNNLSYHYETQDAFHVGTFFWRHSEKFSKMVFEKDDYLRFLNSRRGRAFDAGERLAFDKLWNDWTALSYDLTGIGRWDESPVKRFIDICCIEGNAERLTLKKAYDAYLAFCAKEQLTPLTKIKFRIQMDFAGFAYDPHD